MNSPMLGLRVASVVFGLMALGQLARLVIQPQVLVAGHAMPLWPSALALVILGGLAFWMWQLAHVKQMSQSGPLNIRPRPDTLYISHET